MTGILKITKIRCTGLKARAEVLEALQTFAEHVNTNELAVMQYLVGVPIERSNESDIYLSEEFMSQAAYDVHEHAQQMKVLESLLNDSRIVSEPPVVCTGSIAIKKTSGPPIPLASDPAILLIEMGYQPGTLSNAVLGWKDMAEGAVQSVPGVNVFTVMEDPRTSSIRTVEVLDSWDSLSILVNTDAAKQNIEHNGKDRSGKKSAIRLKAIAGFIGRS